jgi:hypothetical protein
MTLRAQRLHCAPMKRFLTLLVLGLMLAGCAGEAPAPPLTPMPSAPQDPSDAQLRAAISDILRERGAPLNTDYQIARYDLNTDHLREGIVLISAPYGYWCDTNGCPLWVFEAQDNSFKFVNAVAPVRAPVYAAHLKNAGWHVLLTRVSGRAARAKDAALFYNGSTYETDPSRAHDYPISSETIAATLFIR